MDAPWVTNWGWQQGLGLLQHLQYLLQVLFLKPQIDLSQLGGL